MKKLNKLFIIFICFQFYTLNGLSQVSLKFGSTHSCWDRLFYRVNYAHNFPLAPSYIGSNETNVMTTSTDEVVNGSYGRGRILDLGIGYRACSNFALALEADCFKGCYYDFTDKFESLNFTSTDIERKSIHGVNILPSVVFYNQFNRSISPYAEIGAVVPVSLKMRRTLTQEYNSDKIVAKETIKPKFSLGAYAGIGVDYQIKYGLLVVRE